MYQLALFQIELVIGFLSLLRRLLFWFVICPTCSKQGLMGPARTPYLVSRLFAAFVDGEVRRNLEPTRWRQERFVESILTPFVCYVTPASSINDVSFHPLPECAA